MFKYLSKKSLSTQQPKSANARAPVEVGGKKYGLVGAAKNFVENYVDACKEFFVFLNIIVWRHRTVVRLQKHDALFPKVSWDAHVHPTSSIVGKVEIYKIASVWPNCVVKGISTKKL